jgi:peptidyl-dipeptidase A
VKSRPEIKPYSCKVLPEVAGEDISTRAMMEYFKPLMAWLEEQNKGR